MNDQFDEGTKRSAPSAPIPRHERCFGVGVGDGLLVAILLLSAAWTRAESGVQAWVQRYSNVTDSDDKAYKVVTDAAGNVIVAGYTDHRITGRDMLVIKYSGAGVPLWTNRFNGPANGHDVAQAVAVDGSGNVFLTGHSAGSGGYADYATIAYSGAGVPLWTNRYNGPANSHDVAQAVAVDDSGNVFVTGYSTGSGGSYDYATIKYSGAGVPLWTNRYNGPLDLTDSAAAVAVDGSGNVFVTGSSYLSYGSDSSVDYATIAYSGAGVPLWTNRFNGPANGDDVAQAVAVDGSGNVFVTGTSYLSFGTDSSVDYATIAYSGAGVPLWTNRYDGPANREDVAQAVAVDGRGNVFVTGSSTGSDSSDVYATIAYSGAGVPLWTNRYNGPLDLTDSAAAVAVDGRGNVFVTGTSYLSFGSDISVDYATIAYSGAGVPLWTNRYSGPANSSGSAQAVAVDGSGNVFVTGSSLADYATIAYSGAGMPLWTNRYNMLVDSDDVANAVAVDGSGNVFVTGYSEGSGGFSDYATIKYSGAGVPLWTNRYNGPANSEDWAWAMAVDGSGNVFVTGSSLTDYATIAYSGAGVPLWTNRYNGPANNDDLANAVAVDGSGNVFVTGSSYGTNNLFAPDYATIAYSGAGVPLWTNRYNGPANAGDSAQAVAVDGGGNVFVTGTSTGDYATIKYSGAGVPLWTNRYDGPANGREFVSAMVVDSSGNVFVTGYSQGRGGFYDYATIAYSGAGVPLWTNRYDGPGNGHDVAQAVAVDGSGNVFVTGDSPGSDGSYDYTTIAYSGAGVPLWTNRYNGPANSSDSAQAVAVDGGGNVFVTGYSYGSGGSYDYATIKYSGAGVPLWTSRYNGPANGTDWPVGRQSLALGPDGSAYVTGSADGNYAGSEPYDFVTVKYVSVPDLSIALTGTNTAMVSWALTPTGFDLQQNTNLNTVNWTAPSETVSSNGTNKFIIANPRTGNRFFRLSRP